MVSHGIDEKAAILNYKTVSSSSVFAFANRSTLHSFANQSSANQSHQENYCAAAEVCSAGLLLPLWNPPAQDILTKTYRAVVYVAALAYLIFGISIITDRIVKAMEVIASQKRSVTIHLKTGGTRVIKVPVWHPVVVSLTVLTIGTSAPEIFLPVIGVYKANLQGDDLGPSLIVGSAAYHFLIITGVCMLSVKETFAKPIDDLYVFLTTTIFAIFAYLWVYLFLGEISPGVVEIWEALLTLAFFPFLVVSAWIASRRFPHRLVSRLARFVRNSVVPSSGRSSAIDSSDGYDDDESQNDQRRRKLGTILQELKLKHPEKTQLELEEMAEIQMLEDTPKNAAFYRLQATKAFSGAGMSKERIKERLEEHNRQNRAANGMSLENTVQTVGFSQAAHTCQESCGVTVITVGRWGPGLSDTVTTVDFETVERTAKTNSNFEASSGKLTFAPGQQFAEISVRILDDGIYEDKVKKFLVRLSKPEIKLAKITTLLPISQNSRASSSSQTKATKVELTVAETEVSILDDDHCGVFAFEKAEQAIPDNIDVAKIKVIRAIGTKGRIAVPYRISQGTAKLNQDYVVASPKGVLNYDDGEFEKFIEVKIIDKNRVGEVCTFYIELLQPKVQHSSDVKSTIGIPSLGEHRLVQLGICEDDELKDALDRLLRMTDLAEFVVSATWLDQFRDAFVVFQEDYHQHSSSISPESYGSHAKPPLRLKLKAYAIHVISLPWKLLVAVLPPARLLHGWVAYLSLLAAVAFTSALIGDCAVYLGCTVGLKDSITAITLIACGMGLPDTFAARHAAMHEKTADAAIGGVMGSNAVSVFLGIGMAWTVGSIYQTSIGQKFMVKSGNLGFSVMLYCSFATAGLLVLLLRRLPPIRGELGGPRHIKMLSGCFFITLWLLFVGLSVLENYCLIKGFSFHSDL